LEILTACINRSAAILSAIALAVTAAGPALADAPSGSGDHNDLLQVFEDYQAWKKPDPTLGLPDYSAGALARKRRDLGVLQARMQDMNVAAWSVPQQVDYLTVRAELDQQDFIFQVTRPWARDPVFYIAGMLEIAFTELPVEGENLDLLRRQLRAVPAALSTARENLTDVAADYADLAIRSLILSDGVENGYPYRAQPPDGVIGWYDDLLARTEVQPELRPDVEAALEALREFHSWLVDNRRAMTAENGVGKDALDWFVQYALLLPYTSEEMVSLLQREYDRLWGFYALERQRNRRLPELALSVSREQYQQRLADTDRLVRDFLVEEAFISIPDFIPDDWREMGYNVPWIVRATPPNFWEQVQFRDPAPDHLHAVIPGHRFDAMVAENLPHPIRSQVNFGARWQGWAVYLEEAALQAGALESRPRTRELIYVFGIWRAARSLGDIWNQWNEMTANETADYWQSATPLLDPDVARKYAYLRPMPGHGLEYTIGNFEMWRLLAERKRQLGDAFVLQDFHDEFIAKGRIPISLIRYEMTGRDDDIERFWDRPPLESVIAR
jgi:hypothetical protein